MINKDNYDKFIFKGSLALESYFDEMNNNISLFDEFNNKLKEYRSKNEKNEQDKEIIVNELLSIIEKLGKDKFILYDDGDVEYNYKNKEKEERNIKSYFEGVIENIDIILNDDFYKQDDKKCLISIRPEIEKWFDDYLKNNTLKNINPETLKDMGLEITTLFDNYIASEPLENNYVERLLFDFGKLEKYWKDEMLGGEING